MRLRGEGGRQSYTPSCSPLLEGPPATRGSNSPLRRRGQTTQYDSGLPATSRRPGWRADLEAQVPAYLRTCLPHTNTSRRLIWFDESGSRPATRRGRADYWVGRTSRIGPNASNWATSGHGVVSRRRPRGVRPSMTDRLLYRRG